MTALTRTRGAALVGCAAVLALGGLVATGTMASASTPADTTVVTGTNPAGVPIGSAGDATAGVSPDVGCRVEITADGDGDGHNDFAHFCFQGTLNTSGLEFDILATDTVNRVWLHQNPNGSGWADCFTGGGSYGLTGRDQHPGNIQVVANGAAC